MDNKKNWANLSSNLLNGVELINKLDSRKFHLFVNRIIKNMIQNPDNYKPFTEEEEEKLLTSFDISRQDLGVLLHSVIVIISKAAYTLTNPEIFKEILLNTFKFTEEKANIFTTAWAGEAKNVILKFKQKSIYSRKLQDLSWLVNIEISSDSNRQTFIPKAVLQMKLIDEKGPSDLTLDMNENELSKLYNAIEDIQTALDSLS